jgi:hypothetical protein
MERQVAGQVAREACAAIPAPEAVLAAPLLDIWRFHSPAPAFIFINRQSFRDSVQAKTIAEHAAPMGRFQHLKASATQRGGADA